MVKWEYLTCSLITSPPYIRVRKAETQALAQHLQSTLAGEVKISRKGEEIEFKHKEEDHMLDALGEMGWELVGCDSVFRTSNARERYKAKRLTSP